MSDTNDGSPTQTTPEMAEKLIAAGEKAVAQKAQSRERTVKGSHLLPAITEQVKAAGLQIEELTGYLKVSAGVKGKNLYIAKKGGKIDLSGFTMENSAIKQISEQEAREKHLGKVRGTIDFDKSDDEVLAAFTTVLSTLAVDDKPAPASQPVVGPSPDQATQEPSTASN